mmetsp:Transcript_18584/g.47484  ORF Transcript_18584/g.47484 Transcript_18584/m.47484 type:complete len:263 (+) Transcript_18584:2374-3162(+)
MHRRSILRRIWREIRARGERGWQQGPADPSQNQCLLRSSRAAPSTRRTLHAPPAAERGSRPLPAAAGRTTGNAPRISAAGLRSHRSGAWARQAACAHALPHALRSHQRAMPGRAELRVQSAARAEGTLCLRCATSQGAAAAEPAQTCPQLCTLRSGRVACPAPSPIRFQPLAKFSRRMEAPPTQFGLSAGSDLRASRARWRKEANRTSRPRHTARTDPQRPRPAPARAAWRVPPAAPPHPHAPTPPRTSRHCCHRRVRRRTR